MSKIPRRDSRKSHSESIDYDTEVEIEIRCDAENLPKAIMAAMDKVEAVFATKQQALELRFEELDRRSSNLTHNVIEGRIANGHSTTNGQNHRAPKGASPPASQRIQNE